MTIDNVRPTLVRLYGRLKGLEESIPRNSSPSQLGDDFNSIVKKLSEALEEDFSEYQLRDGHFYGQTRDFVEINVLRSRVAQFRSFLEYSFQVGDVVISTGNLFRSISDPALHARCSDLLSAPGNFDRVINQATLILEDRIRQKAAASNQLSGVQLVNELVKAKVADSTLVISTDDDEQRGFADIFRGIMTAFRNPTHHRISDRLTRDEAFKVCLFVDELLRIVDQATLRTKAP